MKSKPMFSKKFILKHKWNKNVNNYLDNIIEDGRVAYFYGGKLSREFESKFSKIQGANFGVAMNSGTSALHIAYKLCGIGPGDEVIVPAHGYISALSAALMLDAIPILCDVDPTSYGLCPKALKKCITSRTKLITAVHLYGRPCEIDTIKKIADKYNILLIEDCGQGHGAEINNKPVGTFGLISTWSFFEIKHVSTGEGGMCLFKDKKYADRARSLVYKGKGEGWWDYHEMGYSYMFTEIQAAFGLASLDFYSEQVIQRREIENIYYKILNNTIGIEILPLSSNLKTGAFKTPFRIKKKFENKIIDFCKNCEYHNIPIQKGYPALHNIDWIKNKEHRAWNLIENKDINSDYSTNKLPISTDICGRTLSLATGPNITRENAILIAQTIKSIAEKIFNEK